MGVRWRFWGLGLAMALRLAPVGQSAPPAPAVKAVILATTTSTQDSGLLDSLIPLFEKNTGYAVKTLAVGSGQALALSAKGEADVLLVHSPDAEKNFMAAGHGRRRRLVMHNDFVIVGPPADPVGVKAAATAPAAMKKIASQAFAWFSRADHSGTHATEMKLWQAAGIDPQGRPWYGQTGLGMGLTLNVAAEKRAYTLTDRGTFLAMRKNLGMAIVREGDASLLNIYHVIELDPGQFPKINHAGGKALAEFLVAPATQALIRTFGVDKYGSPLFFPDAGKPE